MELAEIKMGLVLHLDRSAIAAHGGVPSCKPELAVQGGHFFVCVSTAGGSGRWLPLYSNGGEGRERLEVSGRSGHRKWTTGVFYWHRDQVWAAPHAAVVAAATAGGDRSRPGRPICSKRHRRSTF